MHSKYNPDTVDKLYNHLCLGMPLRFATASVGISTQTYYNWQDKYPEFKHRMDEAKAEFVGYHLKNIKKHSEHSAQQSQWLLERTLPDIYGNKRLQEMEAVNVLVEAGWLPTSFVGMLAESVEGLNEGMKKQFAALDTLESDLQARLEQAKVKHPTPLPVLLDSNLGTLDLDLV